jgi:hypothetical protein
MVDQKCCTRSGCIVASSMSVGTCQGTQPRKCAWSDDSVVPGTDCSGLHMPADAPPCELITMGFGRGYRNWTAGWTRWRRRGHPSRWTLAQNVSSVVRSLWNPCGCSSGVSSIRPSTRSQDLIWKSRERCSKGSLTFLPARALVQIVVGET